MKNHQEEIIKMLSGAADNLVKVISSSTFEFWQRKDFRLYVDFSHLDKAEQDRMFNELEVSILGLFVLHLAYTDVSMKKEYVGLLHAIRDDLAPGFLEMMADMGIENKYVKLWEGLIDMRLKEYRGDFQIALSESKKMKEFKKDEEQLRAAWARIETITIDCLFHLRRGNVKNNDPLWKLLRIWLISLDAQLNPITSLASQE